MGLYRSGGGGDFGRFAPAPLRQVSFFLGQLDALVSDNDPVEVSLLLDVNNVARMNVFSDKNAVEDRYARPRRAPLRAVKADRAGVEQKLNRGVVRDAERFPAE